VNTIAGVGFQENRIWDIQIDNSANDTYAVWGCRTESPNFIIARNGAQVYIAGCDQINNLASTKNGYFASVKDCAVTIDNCLSYASSIVVGDVVRLAIRNSSFGLTNWLNISSPLISPAVIEIEHLMYGGTPNSNPFATAKFVIARQRITHAGTYDYAVGTFSGGAWTFANAADSNTLGAW